MERQIKNSDKQPPLLECNQDAMDRTEVGQNIMRFRDELDMTQAELAEKIGAEATKISKIERGTRNLYMSAFFSIAVALSVTPNDLCPHRVLVGTPLELYNQLTSSERAIIASMIKTLLMNRSPKSNN